MGFFIFSIEGVSMIGAYNAIKNKLFNGQETSTRYLNFIKLGFIPISKNIDVYSKKWMVLYKQIRVNLMENLLKNGVPETEANTKNFWYCWSFSANIRTTNIFWVSNIRTYITKIRKLISGDEESREIDFAISRIFNEICPNSMSVKDVGINFFKKKWIWR